MPASRDVDEEELSEEDEDFQEDEEDEDRDDGRSSQKQSKKRKGSAFIDDAAEEDDDEDDDEVCLSAWVTGAYTVVSRSVLVFSTCADNIFLHVQRAPLHCMMLSRLASY